MQARYLHYSFDLWLTLIRSNPAFKEERTRYFHRNFNTLQKPLEEVAGIFRETDLMCNAINERTGGNIDAEEMYLMVIARINGPSFSLHEVDIHRLYTEMEQLIFRYMPVVYCDRTRDVLQQLKQRDGVSISLLSNTGFIKGTTLRKVLTALEIAPLLDVQCYSDEDGMSKPNASFYRKMMDRVALYRGSALELHHMLHVGDNPLADEAGAKAMGMHSLLINSNHLTITTLLS